MSETLRDLVVSLSLQTDNFTRNIKSVNKQIQEAESRNKIFHISSSAFSSLHIPAIRKVQVSDFIWSRLIRNFMAVTLTESPRTKEKELPLA